MTNNWKYNNNDFVSMSAAPTGTIGFIYMITHKPSGKWYIGRRLFTKPATMMVNGKKKKIRKENDWKDYWSSNDEIKMMAKEDPSQFERKILIFVPTMGAMTLGEEYLLHVSGALFDKNCYNNNIRAKIFSSWFTKIPDFWTELSALNYKR